MAPDRLLHGRDQTAAQRLLGRTAANHQGDAGPPRVLNTASQESVSGMLMWDTSVDNVKLGDVVPGHQRPTGSGSFDQSKEERSDLLERDFGEARIRVLAAPRGLDSFGLFGWSLFLLWRHFLEKSHKLMMSRSFNRLIIQ